MTNSAQGNKRVQEIQEAKRRRYTEVQDTSSSNQIPSTDRQTKTHNDNGQCSSKAEKVVFNEDMEMKERLKQLHTVMLTQKIKPLTNYTVEMVSLLNRRSIRSTVSPPCFNPSSSQTQNPQVPPPPIKIPTWMPLLFRPPSDMSLNDIEAETFIFVNDNDTHWYLVVFDLEEENVWLLDSNPFPDRNKWHKLHVKNLAIIIEDMLMDRTFYELTSYECPAISNFTLTELEGLSQHLTSYNDCGVQVSRWMMECISNDNYQSIGVNAESSMRLALDLVLDMHNQIRNETVQKAHQKFKVFTEGWNNFDDI
ncbi:Ulp1 protease family, C-terminal catalytic domain [Sesbania bispinosa]|nr:Ulp1 protease family, C-terminal catalytic domain [Sesbania bispinosa]